LAIHDRDLTRFRFLLLLYFAMFCVVSARERREFWSSLLCTALIIALIAGASTGTLLTLLRFPGLAPLSWTEILPLFTYAMASCFITYDGLKVAMIRWLIPAAAA